MRKASNTNTHNGQVGLIPSKADQALTVRYKDLKAQSNVSDTPEHLPQDGAWSHAFSEFTKHMWTAAQTPMQPQI